MQQNCGKGVIALVEAIDFLRKTDHTCLHYAKRCRDCPLGNKMKIADCRCPHLLEPIMWTDEITTEMVRAVDRTYEEINRKEKKKINNKEKIIGLINNISGKYSPYEVFCDFVKCGAISVSNSLCIFHDKVWIDRENEYNHIMNKYQEHERKKFAEMLYLLTIELEDNISDVLGSVYMMAGLGNKSTGQFFTPYHVSQLMAQFNHFDENEQIKKINEPSCGAGGSIIAVAEAMKIQGINYQNKMEVVAQDIDWKCVYMCYLQLSLLGISAVVVQGDTLMQPYNPTITEPSHVLYTPKKMGVII